MVTGQLTREQRMKDGTCPKCSSTDVRITKLVNTELMTGAYEFDAYFCPSCGYIEHYVADPASLGAAAGWPKASG